ncbi:MAG: SDR family NAD(P)-dependent oxidoreductase [Aliidongia sp.]
MTRGAAFVVGGSGGLGSAICRRLAQDWDAVIVGYRSGKEAAETIAGEIAAQCHAMPLRCDLRDAENVRPRLAKRAGASAASTS